MYLATGTQDASVAGFVLEQPPDAVLLEGFRFVGIETDKDYAAIASARINAARRQTVIGREG